MSPRTRLLQRFAVFPDGMRFLVDMRAELLPLLKSDKRLLALDAELEQLFSTWFDVAFLGCAPVVGFARVADRKAHQVRGGARHPQLGRPENRLDSDRRCYGFFHPGCPTSR